MKKVLPRKGSEVQHGTYQDRSIRKSTQNDQITSLAPCKVRYSNMGKTFPKSRILPRHTEIPALDRGKCGNADITCIIEYVQTSEVFFETSIASFARRKAGDIILFLRIQ